METAASQGRRKSRHDGKAARPESIAAASLRYLAMSEAMESAPRRQTWSLDSEDRRSAAGSQRKDQINVPHVDERRA